MHAFYYEIFFLIGHVFKDGVYINLDNHIFATPHPRPARIPSSLFFFFFSPFPPSTLPFSPIFFWGGAIDHIFSPNYQKLILNEK